MNRIVLALFLLLILCAAAVIVQTDNPYTPAPITVPPVCGQSHQEIVKAHDDIYVYDLHTKFVGPQMSITHVPETTIMVCDRWDR